MQLRTLLGVVALLSALPVAAEAPRRDADGVRSRVAQPLSASLEALDFYGSEEAINLRFNLTNRTDHSLWILKWNLPGEEMDAPLFDVRRDGEAVSYQGPLVKRAQPEAGDYIEIKAGETWSVIFDPSAHYDMALQGQYQLRLRNARFAVRHAAPEARNLPLEQSLLVRRDRAVEAFRLDTAPQDRLSADAAPTASFTFQGVANAGRTATLETVIGGYNRCKTAQQTDIQTAHGNAIAISGKAINHLNANPGGSTLYAYWFGTFSTSNYNLVKDHYAKVNDAFANKSVVYDCACSKSAYAYVYPTQPYRIYLCRAFWTAPALGRDSKTGTLVHEMTHFNVVASTQDHVYGAAGAHNLALTDPAKAIMNADNHEYFAEDQP